MTSAHPRITIEPDDPCIRGMRITVNDVLGWLSHGMTEEDTLDENPGLEKEDVAAVYAFAAQTAYLGTAVADPCASRSCLQCLENMNGERVFDFPISRHGLRIPGHWVAIPVVLGSIADENAALGLYFANEIRPPQPKPTANSATERTPGIWPLVR